MTLSRHCEPVSGRGRCQWSRPQSGRHRPQRRIYPSIARPWSEAFQVRIKALAVLKLDAEAIQHHADLGVLAGRENHIHALALIEVTRQRRSGLITNEPIRMQFVAGVQQRHVGIAPTRRVRERSSFRQAPIQPGRLDPFGLAMGNIALQSSTMHCPEPRSTRALKQGRHGTRKND